MNNSSSTVISAPEMLTSIIDSMLNAISETQKGIAQSLWGVLMSTLSAHWLIILVVLILVLALAFAMSFFGRWGFFAKTLYHYIYFGILFIIGLIFGPEIFANTFISILLIILYFICFRLVGKILKGLNFKKH